MNSNYPVGEHISHYTDSNGERHCFDACYVKITSNKIVNTLCKYGIVQGKKYKDINFLHYIPDEFKIDFILGYFDGDGSISFLKDKPDRVVLTIATNKSLTLGIQNTLYKCGVTSNIYKRENIDIITIQKISSVCEFTKIYLEKSNIYTVLQRKLNIFRRVFNSHISQIM